MVVSAGRSKFSGGHAGSDPRADLEWGAPAARGTGGVTEHQLHGGGGRGHADQHEPHAEHQHWHDHHQHDPRSCPRPLQLPPPQHRHLTGNTSTTLAIPTVAIHLFDLN